MSPQLAEFSSRVIVCSPPINWDINNKNSNNKSHLSFKFDAFVSHSDSESMCSFLVVVAVVYFLPFDFVVAQDLKCVWTCRRAFVIDFVLLNSIRHK